MQVLLKKLQQRRERLKQKYPNKLKQGKLLARRTREIIKLKLATTRKMVTLIDCCKFSTCNPLPLGGQLRLPLCSYTIIVKKV